ncbi:AAA family ATPase [Halocynthiibacter sp.]|uniref:AAA family ATPase n=1 Tax=Halocynthiibacter sp. TaxID=1979210 RepID=UPI003C3C0634
MNFEEFCRPQTSADLHFADQLVASQFTNIATGKLDSGVVLVGPPGTGKSAAAKVLAEQRNQHANPLFQVPYVFEGKLLTSFTEIENTLNALLGSVAVPFIVINEFDQIPLSTLNSLQAFWNVHSHHCGLVLTTNKLSAISAAMRSRLLVLDVQCPPSSCLLPAAQAFLKSRGKSIHDAKVLNVLAAAGNDMRTRIFAIDQLAI